MKIQRVCSKARITLRSIAVPTACAISPIWAQTQQPPPAPPAPDQAFTTDHLDDLAAPIALYSNSLLCQILAASTHPLEIVDANQRVQTNARLTGPIQVQAAQHHVFDSRQVRHIVGQKAASKFDAMWCYLHTTEIPLGRAELLISERPFTDSALMTQE